MSDTLREALWRCAEQEAAQYPHVRVSFSRVARHVGVTQTTMGHWMAGRSPIPPVHVVKLHQWVPVEELRPDLEWQYEDGKPVGYLVRVNGGG